MAGLSDIIANTATQTTSMPSWYDTAQQNIASQAGQIAPAQSGSVNPISLANALRNKPAMNSPIQSVNAYMPWTQNQISNAYGTDPYSEQSRMLAMQERGL